MKTFFKKSIALVVTLLMLITSIPVMNLEGVNLGFAAEAATITSYSRGDIIEFGWYPQSKVTDESIISALNSSSCNWVSYKYYSGTGSVCDGEMIASDYMRYTDVIYGNDKYRGVVFDSFRPYYTGYTSSISHTRQYENGYNINTVYWFKYEPIKWRVLNPKTGMVMADTILDSQAYNNYSLFWLTTDVNGNNEYWSNPSKTSYANNYSESSIRKWLNNDFYDTAFSSEQQNMIQYTNLNNTAVYSTYNSSATCDKIYLLSYSDLLNTNYGFTKDENRDINRSAEGTDYAKCQGLQINTTTTNGKSSNWFLRTPSYASYCCFEVGDAGGLIYYYNTYITDCGVRPAINITSLSEIFQSSVKDIGNKIDLKCNHIYKLLINSPTCENKGYTTYTCECGDTYVADYVDENGHKYKSEITTPATHLNEGVETFTCYCGDTYTKPIAKLEGHTYTSEVTKEPTHLEEGETTYTCECGDSYTEPLAKLEGHTYTSKTTKEPTHLEEGETTFTCECGDSYAEPIAKLEGHTYTSEITKEATHLEEGILTNTCECGDSYTESIEKIKNHTYVANVIAPTCSEKGYTLNICECGYSYISDYVGMIAHSYVYSIIKPSAHISEGLGRYTCSECGDHYDEPIAKTKEHSYTSTVVDSTCIEQGYTLNECECGDSYKSNYLAKIDHTDSNSDGVCDKCGHDFTDNCSCNCHKGGISGFFFKIILFFQKIFKSNKTCACGVNHY